MIKSAIGIIIMISMHFATCAQDINELLSKLPNAKIDSARISLLLQISTYYINKDNDQKVDLDSARFYYQEANKINMASVLNYYPDKFKLVRAAYLWKAKQYGASEKDFNELAQQYHISKNYRQEAKVWVQFGAVINLEKQTHIILTDKVYQRAYNSYRLAGDQMESAHALGRFANVDLIRGRYAQAEKKMLEVISAYKILKYPQIYYGYYLLAEIFYRKNELQKELLYRIECLQSFDTYPKGKDYDRMAYNFKLAEAYFRLKNYEKSIPYFEKSIALAASQNRPMLYYHFVGNLVDVYAHLKKYKAGLILLHKAKRKFPSDSDEIRRKVISSELRLYNHLGRKDQAATVIPDFKRVYQKNFEELASSENYHAINTFIYTYEPLLRYYILTRRWDSLSVELEKLDGLPKKNMTVLSDLMLRTSHFKLDSAQGKLLSALETFQKIKTLQDSLSNAEKTSQINELEAKYLSVKKDRTIQRLNAQATLQKASIERINTQRNATLAGIFVSAVMVLFIYLGYRGKHRSNARLKAKQEEINIQNSALSTLIVEKDSLIEDKDILLKKQQNLIEDKEWLLKEVHHRVKNNLQIVMSLLYTQSAYLKNSDAIDAIKDSQNRIQAISIIHQKLYNKTEVGHILLSDYVGELVSYLSNSFSLGSRKIKFHMEIIQEKLDISQAVPIGLILNEAITNSIKYAFDNPGGLISVIARKVSDGIIELMIKDDGRGMPTGFDHNQATSLGIEMMKALSRQLGGNLNLSPHPGVTIALQFEVIKVKNKLS